MLPTNRLKRKEELCRGGVGGWDVRGGMWNVERGMRKLETGNNSLESEFFKHVISKILHP
jgi:hypothetical protein